MDTKMRLAALFSVFALLLVSTVALAAEGDTTVKASLLMRPRIITLKDGEEVNCVVIAAGWRGYLVVVDGEEAFYPLEKVESIKDAPDVDETSLNVKAFAVGVRDGSFVLTSQDAYIGEEDEGEGDEKPDRPRRKRDKKDRKDREPRNRRNRQNRGGNNKKDTKQVFDNSKVIDLTDGTTTELSKNTVRGGYTSGNDNQTPPTVTSATTAYRVIGRDITYQITGTNSPSSYAASDLPEGLTLNKQTGVISGKLDEIKSHTFTVKALNGDGTGTAQVTLHMEFNGGSPGTITRAPGAAWKARFAGATGAFRFSAVDVPDDILFDANTGQYRGPDTMTAGTYSFDATAHYASGTGTETIQVVIETLDLLEANAPADTIVTVQSGVVFALPDAGAITDATVTIEGETPTWVLDTTDAAAGNLKVSPNTDSDAGEDTDNSHFNYDTRLDCKVAGADKTYYLNVVPARDVTLTVSEHPLLPAPAKTMADKFTDAAAKVSVDDDGVYLLKDSKTTADDMLGVEGKDDVDLDLTFTVNTVADFPDQSEDAGKDEAERYDYTHPSYLVIWDTASLYQLRAGTFSNIKQVESASIGGLVLDGFSKFGGNSMILVNDCQDATTVHEWMHNCKIYHRSDRPQGVEVTPQAGMPYFDSSDTTALYFISYGDSANVNEINRSERTKMLDWDPTWTGDEGDSALLRDARIVGWPEAVPSVMTTQPAAGKPVVLSGQNSTSDTGSVAAYRWRQLSGPAVTLTPQDGTATFVPTRPGTYVFDLVVEDASGLTSEYQAGPSAVAVTVKP